MTPSLYLTVAGRSPQRHATLSRPTTHRILHITTVTPYYTVLRRTTKSTPYYKVSTPGTTVLQSTTPHYKVLLHHYSVLQSTTPALLSTTNYYVCTTKYSSSTGPQFLRKLGPNFHNTGLEIEPRFPAKLNTSPVLLLRASKYYYSCVLQSTTLY